MFRTSFQGILEDPFNFFAFNVFAEEQRNREADQSNARKGVDKMQIPAPTTIPPSPPHILNFARLSC
jgi:hypothetical protein